MVLVMVMRLLMEHKVASSGITSGPFISMDRSLFLKLSFRTELLFVVVFIHCAKPEDMG